MCSSKTVRALLAGVLLCAAHSVQAEVRVLLVGVGVYPHLAGKNLEGPANDLRLMRSVVQRLQVAPQHVTELSDSAGPARLPTRANILSALDRLARDSGPGDWALVYFSGHGAQVPQSVATRHSYAEPDGLDEAFLPRDTRRWVPARGVVEGAIVDDEFAVLFDRIRARGARLWAIFDTCHAGDMTRSAAGPGAERPVWRVVQAQELGVPALGPRRQGKAALLPAPASAQRPHAAASVRAAAMPSTVAYFASQPDEPAAEELFADPLASADQPARRRFGVFTYQLHQAMAGWTGDFDTLATALQTAYRSRPFPTPQFSGDLQQRFPGVTPAATLAAGR
jgi:hypothetical protein